MQFKTGNSMKTPQAFIPVKANLFTWHRAINLANNVTKLGEVATVMEIFTKTDDE